MANLKSAISGEGQRIGKAPAGFALNITHLLDPRDKQDETLCETFILDTPSPRTKVAIKSHVSYRTKHLSSNSPAYLASVRRRGAARARKLVADLAIHSTSDDFAAYTHAVLFEIKALLKILADAEEQRSPRSEANSCEILRQLRDSLLNDGWNAYRNSNVRHVVLNSLRVLSEADTITADDAFRLGDSLLDLDIEPAIGGMNCEEESDAEEKVLD